MPKNHSSTAQAEERCGEAALLKCWLLAVTMQQAGEGTEGSLRKLLAAAAAWARVVMGNNGQFLGSLEA